MTRNEDSVSRDQVSGLKMEHISSEDVINGDLLKLSRSNNFDQAIGFLS